MPGRRTSTDPPVPPQGGPHATPAKHAKNDRYRALFDHGPQPYLVIDPRTGAVVEANAAAREFYGYAQSELVGIEIWRLNGWEPDHALEWLARATQTPTSALRIPHLASSGDTRIVEVYTGPIELDGQTLLYSISHDITERVRLERQNERLNRLAAAVSALSVALRTAVDEEGVFRETVGLLVSVGGAAAALVGLVEPGSRGLRIVTVDGDEKRIAAGIKANEGFIRPSSAALSSAIENGRVVLHLRSDPDLPDDWPSILSDLDVESGAVVPIGVSEFTLGIIGVLADDPDFFGEPEISLFEQMAALVATRLGEIEQHERETALAATIEAHRSKAELVGTLTMSIDRRFDRISRFDNLYQEACRVPVDLGICALARFGLIEVDGKGQRMRFVATAADDVGLQDGALTLLGRSMPLSTLSDLPTPVASTTVFNDLMVDPRLRRRHAVLAAAGLNSLAAVPVFAGQRQVGSMAFYSREVGAFGGQEVALLDRLAVNVGHRLAIMELERDRRLAEKRIARLLGANTTNVAAELGPED